METPGFHSRLEKDKYTTLIWIIGGISVVVQTVVPMALSFLLMPTMMVGGGMEIRQALVEDAVYWDRKVWYVESTMSTGPGAAERYALMTPGSEEPVPLSLKRPRLLPDGETLWLISPDGTARFQNGRVRVVDSTARGEIVAAFLHEGAPASIEDRPEGLSTRRLVDGQWVREPTLDPNVSTSRAFDSVQVLSMPDGLVWFARDGDVLYSRAGLPTGEGTWKPVADVYGTDWKAVALDGKPAVFVPGSGEELLGLSLQGEDWKPFARVPIKTWREFGVTSGGAGRDFVLLTSGMPGTLKVVRFENGVAAEPERYGGFFPFDGPFMWVMVAANSSGFLVSIAVILILAALMNRYRVREYAFEKQSVEFASLTRRAIARGIDGLLLGTPFMIGWIWLIVTFMAVIEDDPSQLIVPGILAGGGMCWSLLGTITFSFMEGSTGRTPGKWLAGIRVLGDDLKPCGFWRAFGRSLLMIADGFFGFMVGVVCIALTAKWQRVGDLAVKTVVVRTR